LTLSQDGVLHVDRTDDRRLLSAHNRRRDNPNAVTKSITAVQPRADPRNSLINQDADPAQHKKLRGQAQLEEKRAIVKA